MKPVFSYITIWFYASHLYTRWLWHLETINASSGWHAPFFKLWVSSGKESNVLKPLHISFSTLSLSISIGLGSLSITMASTELERGSHWSNKAFRCTRLSVCRLSLAEILRFSDFTICSVLILSLSKEGRNCYSGCGNFQEKGLQTLKCTKEDWLTVMFYRVL